MSEPDGTHLLTTQQAAGRLQVSRGTIYNLLAAGELDSITVATTRRVTLASLQAYVDRQLAVAKAAHLAATAQVM